MKFGKTYYLCACKVHKQRSDGCCYLIILWTRVQRCCYALGYCSNIGNNQNGLTMHCLFCHWSGLCCSPFWFLPETVGYNSDTIFLSVSEIETERHTILTNDKINIHCKLGAMSQSTRHESILIITHVWAIPDSIATLVVYTK